LYFASAGNVLIGKLEMQKSLEKNYEEVIICLNVS